MKIKTSQLKTVTIIAMMTLALGACSTDRRGGKIPYDAKNFGAPDVIPLSPEATQYHIAPADTLAISVYEVPDLTRTVQVDDKGGFEYPPLGRIEANGRTASDIKQELTTRLGDKYLQSPSVDVVLKTTVSNQVTIDGAVNGPGQYPIMPGTTLMQAITLAKGTIKDANLRRVVVFRRINGQRMAAAFDLKDIRRGINPDPEIFAHDIIIVENGGVPTQFTNALMALPLLAIFHPF
jgi:polysaccharide export outer membrane protein